jgi:hypothetical protein
MRRALLFLLPVLLAGCLYAWAQGVHHPMTTVYDFLNGFQLNGGTVITGTSGAQDSAVVLPANSVGGAELSGIGLRTIYCGQADENGTIFLAPALSVLGGDASADTSIGSTACDALDSADEATADGALLANVALKARGVYCKTDGTLGAGESIVFTLRSAVADTTPVLSCTLSAAQTDCRSLVGTTTNIAAGGTTAIKAVMSSNNADDNLWCLVDYMMQ